MRRGIALLVLMGVAVLCSCGNKGGGPANSTTEAPAAGQAASGPHAVVHLQDGSKVAGTIVASSATDMVVAGDDGIERRIPLTQIKSVEYGAGQARKRRVSAEQASAQTAANEAAAPASVPPAAPPTVTYQLSPGSEISVMTNEAIDSGTASEGQTFDAQVTRDVRDANGDVVIPRGSGASVVIKSASKGNRFRGASDLVLDLQSAVVNGQTYSIETADISQKGKSGFGANKRSAEYTGGGAALGAIIGAIAGHGKGAGIGAGAGAGAGALTQLITKGGAIKVPAESVLTFKLDKPLTVTATQ